MRNFFAGLTVFLCTSANAVAQGNQIPTEMLELAFQECRRDCIKQADGASCEFLCRCSSVEELPKRMSFDQYLAFRQSLVDGEVAPAIQAILDDIGKMCFARFEASGMKIGAPEEDSNQQ